MLVGWLVCWWVGCSSILQRQEVAGATEQRKAGENFTATSLDKQKKNSKKNATQRNATQRVPKMQKAPEKAMSHQEAR
jgi:hypothetical protein